MKLFETASILFINQFSYFHVNFWSRQDEAVGELALEALKNKDGEAWRRHTAQLKDLNPSQSTLGVVESAQLVKTIWNISGTRSGAVFCTGLCSSLPILYRRASTALLFHPTISNKAVDFEENYDLRDRTVLCGWATPIVSYLRSRERRRTNRIRWRYGKWTEIG